MHTENPNGAEVYREAYFRGLRPDPSLWVDQWADEYMRIPRDTGAAEPGNRDHVERWLFDDGGSLTYDWQAHNYSIVLTTGSVDIKVGSSSATVTDNAVVVTSGAIALDGDVTIYGEVLVNGGLRVTGDINGGGAIIDTSGNTANHKH